MYPPSFSQLQRDVFINYHTAHCFSLSHFTHPISFFFLTSSPVFLCILYHCARQNIWKSPSVLNAFHWRSSLPIRWFPFPSLATHHCFILCSINSNSTTFQHLCNFFHSIFAILPPTLSLGHWYITTSVYSFFLSSMIINKNGIIAVSL